MLGIPSLSVVIAVTVPPDTVISLQAGLPWAEEGTGAEGCGSVVIRISSISDSEESSIQTQQWLLTCQSLFSLVALMDGRRMFLAVFFAEPQFPYQTAG